MTDQDFDDRTSEYSESVDAELMRAMQSIQRELIAGIEPDLETYVHRLPQHAEKLAHYLQTMRAIASLGMDETSSDGDSVSSSVTNKQIGEFTLVRELGRGGMGVVYEAVQQTLDRSVALKILPFAGIADERQLQRFRNEARAAATLHHPHIVPVHSVGSDKGIHYFAMQLIKGASLAEIIRGLRVDAGLVDTNSSSTSSGSSREAESTGETQREVQAAVSTLRDKSKTSFHRKAVAWIAQAANGLAHAHEHGVLHRDIKPGNLMVDANGSVWIADFGLARLESDASITGTGDLLGTLRYMAPEQASGNGELVDQRADVFGLGLTLFELLTLQPGYSGESRDELLNQVGHQAVIPIRKIDPSISTDLETIVLKATTRDVNDRYHSAREFEEDLLAFLANRPIAAKRPSLLNRSWKWATRHQGLVSTVTLSLVLAALLVGIIQQRANQQIRKSLADVKSKNHELEIAKKEVDDALNMATSAVSNFYRRYRSKVLGRLSEIPELKGEYDWFYAESTDYFRRLADLRPKDASINSEAAMAIYQYGMAYSKSPASKLAQESLREAFALVKDLDPESIPTENLRGYIQTLVLYSSYASENENERGALLRRIEDTTKMLVLRNADTHDESKLRDLGFIQGNLRAMCLKRGDAARSKIWASESVKTLRRALEIAPDDELIRAYLVDAILKEGNFDTPCRKRAISVMEPLVQAPILEHPQGDFPDRFMQLAAVLANEAADKQTSLALWDRAFEYAKRYGRGLPAYNVFREYKQVLLMQNQIEQARETNNRQRQFVTKQPNRFRSQEARLEANRDCVRFDTMLLTLEGRHRDAVRMLRESPIKPNVADGETTTREKVTSLWSMPRAIANILSSPATRFDATDLRWRIRDTMLEFTNDDSDAFNLWAEYAFGERDVSDQSQEKLLEMSEIVLGDWSQHKHLAAWGILGPAIFLDSHLDETAGQLCETLIESIEAEMPATLVERDWHSVIAWAYMRLGRHEQAKRAFLKADDLQRYSNCDTLLGPINNKLGLAIAHSMLGERDAAQESFSAALAGKLSPGQFLARDTLRLMNEAAKLTDSQEVLTNFLKGKSMARDLQTP